MIKLIKKRNNYIIFLILFKYIFIIYLIMELYSQHLQFYKDTSDFCKNNNLTDYEIKKPLISYINRKKFIDFLNHFYSPEVISSSVEADSSADSSEVISYSNNEVKEEINESESESKSESADKSADDSESELDEVKDEVEVEVEDEVNESESDDE